MFSLWIYRPETPDRKSPRTNQAWNSMPRSPWSKTCRSQVAVNYSNSKTGREPLTEKNLTLIGEAQADLNGRQRQPDSGRQRIGPRLAQQLAACAIEHAKPQDRRFA